MQSSSGLVAIPAVAVSGKAGEPSRRKVCACAIGGDAVEVKARQARAWRDQGGIASRATSETGLDKLHRTAWGIAGSRWQGQPDGGVGGIACGAVVVANHHGDGDFGHGEVVELPASASRALDIGRRARACWALRPLRSGGAC